MVTTHSEALLWLAVLGPPTFWSVHLLLVYLLVSLTSQKGVTFVRVEVALVTVAALLLIAACGWIAYTQHVTDVQDTEESDTEFGRIQWMRRISFYGSALFFISTIFTALPAFVLTDF